MKRMMTAALTLTVLAGCEPETDTVELVTLSRAPFASKASIESDYERDAYVVELSVGVAVAVGCWDTCYPEEICKLTIADPEKLGIRRLYHLGNSAQDDYVLVGQKIGTSTLRVDAACTNQEYVVRVVER